MCSGCGCMRVASCMVDAWSRLEMLTSDEPQRLEDSGGRQRSDGEDEE